MDRIGDSVHMEKLSEDQAHDWRAQDELRVTKRTLRVLAYALIASIVVHYVQAVSWIDATKAYDRVRAALVLERDLHMMDHGIRDKWMWRAYECEGKQ